MKGYEELGKSESNLLLNTKGKLKVRWGNYTRDLLDENGQINIPEMIDIGALIRAIDNYKEQQKNDE